MLRDRSLCGLLYPVLCDATIAVPLAAVCCCAVAIEEGGGGVMRRQGDAGNLWIFIL